jgi:hypothetical protein
MPHRNKMMQTFGHFAETPCGTSVRSFILISIDYDDAFMTPEERKRWTPLLALTALSAQYTTVLMSLKPERADWNANETAALVDYLYEHKSEAGDGGSFKNQTFNAAVQAISGFRTAGPPKTAKMCKTKWAAVSDISIHCCTC